MFLLSSPLYFKIQGFPFQTDTSQGNLYTGINCLCSRQSTKKLVVRAEFFLKQPSPQLVDNCTWGSTPFPLDREFPAPAYNLFNASMCLCKKRENVYYFQSKIIEPNCIVKCPELKNLNFIIQINTKQ
jgi:hypothetical protein